MSNELLAIIGYIIISFTWVAYLVQEMFITGSSALNMFVCKNEAERKQIQVSSGLHFDGIEVWFVVALTITIGAFPLVIGTIFSYMYIIIFLLIYAIIARGVSIEVIYKLDSPRWIKSMTITWTVSSILIIFILGVYITNIFYGFPLDSSGMISSYVSIFNITGIAGGLLFAVLALASGSSWIKLNTVGDLGERAIKAVKKVGIFYTIPVLLLLVFMGFNNTEASIFIGELFSKSFVFFVFPLLTVVFATFTAYMGFKEKGKNIFIFSILTMLLFLLTGFIGAYPYMVTSHIAIGNGITIFDAMVHTKALQLIFIVSLIFFPIIIGYQTWKYYKFTDKIKLNDE